MNVSRFPFFLLILQADSPIKILPSAALKWPYYEKPSVCSYNTKHIAEEVHCGAPITRLNYTPAQAPAVLNLLASLTSGTKWK